MLLKSFRVRKFRNIVDSGEIEADPSTTCLVGKNEAGKSGILEALYLFNPAYGEKFSKDEQYPRWLVVTDRKSGKMESAKPITVYLELEPSDIEQIENIFGKGVFKSKQLEVSKKYSGKTIWDFDWNEEKVVKHIISEFPKDVQQFFKVKTHSEILSVIESKENDEDLIESFKQVKEILDEKGIGHIDDTIWQAIVNLLKSKLPKFFRFTEYSYLPGRIDFKEVINKDEAGPASSSIQTVKALLALAGTDFDQLGNDDYELRKSELEAVQIDLTKQVFEYWKQNPNLEVLIDVDKDTVKNVNGNTAVSRFLDIRLRDKRTGYSNNFSQRSSGFRWFFSFLAAFSEFEEQDSPIVLLDEPALTLHGKAQTDFLRFIKERIAPYSPVIYTTHSPFMVEVGRLERVRIVEDQGPPNGSIVTDKSLSSDPDSLFPLQAALGYDIAQSLFIGNHNLVVEGTSDFIYLTIMSMLCGMKDKYTLHHNWRILPAGGATNIPTFVSLIGPHLDITVLADSDTKGMQKVTNMTESGLLKSSRLILASDAIDSNKADIEDLFSPGDYLKLYNNTFNENIKQSNLPSGDRIVKMIEATKQESFDHGLVAETLLRKHTELKFSETTLNNFEKLIKLINKTMDA